MSKQPGAGLGVRLGEGLVGIDIDTDDEDFKFRIMSRFVPRGPVRPGSEIIEWKTISRIGGRGELFFLRVHRGRQVQSKKYLVGGGAVLEVLSIGKRCVLPPTVHPNGNPYRWGANGWTLYNAEIEKLPEWMA